MPSLLFKGIHPYFLPQSYPTCKIFPWLRTITAWCHQARRRRIPDCFWRESTPTQLTGKLFLIVNFKFKIHQGSHSKLKIDHMIIRSCKSFIKRWGHSNVEVNLRVKLKFLFTGHFYTGRGYPGWSRLGKCYFTSREKRRRPIGK